MVNGQSKYWCWTLNNPTDEESDFISEIGLCLQENGLSYLCAGFEFGEGGTPHFQGYLESRTNRRLAALKSIPGFERCHFEVRRGTSQEAADYCAKDGSFVAWGERSVVVPGKRTDLEIIRQRIKDGTSDVAVAEAHFATWCTYRKAFAEYRSLISLKRNWITEVYVLVGNTGTGKSRLVHSVSGDLWCATDCSGKWFDGYKGEADVLFDDFDGDASLLTFFLKLCDRYPMQVPVKGGFVDWLPKRIFFTSNTAAEGWWPTAGAPLFAAFKRRVSKLWIVDDPLEFDEDNNCLDPRFDELK